MAPLDASGTETIRPMLDTCRQEMAPVAELSLLGPAVGGSDVWVTGFIGPQASLQIPISSPVTSYGWETKLTLEIGPSRKGVITITGSNLHDGNPLWFKLSDSDQAVTKLTLDLDAPGRPVSYADPQWSQWGTYMYIPNNGCYVLKASWSKGGWKSAFSAGRL